MLWPICSSQTPSSLSSFQCPLPVHHTMLPYWSSGISHAQGTLVGQLPGDRTELTTGVEADRRLRRRGSWCLVSINCPNPDGYFWGPNGLRIPFEYRLTSPQADESPPPPVAMPPPPNRPPPLPPPRPPPPVSRSPPPSGRSRAPPQNAFFRGGSLQDTANNGRRLRSLGYMIV